MPGLTLASLSTAVAMGQQVYENELTARAGSVLGEAWEVRQITVRTLRSPLSGTDRLPHRILSTGTAPERSMAARILYRGDDVVHRLDLRLPPAPVEVLTIHDVVSWRFPDEAAPPPCAAREARRAEVVICPSQFSADEVATVLGVKSPVAIPNGVDDAVREARPLPDAELLGLGLRRPFLLHTGGCSLRKNLTGLAEAWPLVYGAQRQAQLALAGPPDPRRDGLFAGHPGVVVLGRLDTAVLDRVRASAAGVVVPSIYEGFGLPAIEGMAAGVPVVAARRSSLPEVCGDAGLLVEPTGAGLAEGMVAVLDGGPDIASMLERGRVRSHLYSWDKNAVAHAEIWRSVGNRT
jgi:glycosyltransferase involved in cell wall biosynthesis